VLQADEEDPFRAFNRTFTIPAQQPVPRPAPDIPGRTAQQEIQAMEMRKALQEAQEQEARRGDDELRRLGQIPVSPGEAMELENLHLKRPGRNSSRSSKKKKEEDNKPAARDQPQAMDLHQGQTKRMPSANKSQSRGRQKKQREEEEEDEAAALDKIHIDPKDIARMMDLHQGQTKRQPSERRSQSRRAKKKNKEENALASSSSGNPPPPPPPPAAAKAKANSPAPAPPQPRGRQLSLKESFARADAAEKRRARTATVDYRNADDLLNPKQEPKKQKTETRQPSRPPSRPRPPSPEQLVPPRNVQQKVKQIETTARAAQRGREMLQIGKPKPKPKAKAPPRAQSEPHVPVLPFRSDEPDEPEAPVGGPKGGPFPAPPAKSRSRSARKPEQKPRTPSEIRDLAALTPSAQVAMPLVRASGKKGGGKKKVSINDQPLLAYYDTKDDPYYMRPPLQKINVP